MSETSKDPKELPHNAFMINTGKIYFYFFDSFVGSCNALLTQTACSGWPVVLRPPLAAPEQQVAPAAPKQQAAEFDSDIELTAEAWTQ
jgi:hypothetical protein